MKSFLLSLSYSLKLLRRTNNISKTFNHKSIPATNLQGYFHPLSRRIQIAPNGMLTFPIKKLLTECKHIFIEPSTPVIPTTKYSKLLPDQRGHVLLLPDNYSRSSWPETSQDCIKKFNLSSYRPNFTIVGILTTRRVLFHVFQIPWSFSTSSSIVLMNELGAKLRIF